MNRNAILPILALGSLLCSCSYVDGLMDPSINVNAEFTAYYYLGHDDYGPRPEMVEKRSLSPMLEDGTGDYFNGFGYHASGGAGSPKTMDGSASFYPGMMTSQGTPLSSDETLPVHLGLRDAGYADMLDYGGKELSTGFMDNWTINNEPSGGTGYIGSDFGKTKCLSTIDETFSSGYLSKLYNGQLYCRSTHSLSFVSIDETGFTTRLPKTMVDGDYFLVAFRGGSDDSSHDGIQTRRLVTIDLSLRLFYEEREIDLTLMDCYVNTDNSGEGVSFTGFSFSDLGIDPAGIRGYGLSFSNFRDARLEVGTGEGKISPRAEDESEFHFGLLLYEVMFVNSTWR